MRNLQLKSCTQGIRGGKNTYKEIGFGELILYKGGRNEVEIVVDTFEGQGSAYRERDEAQIKIIFGDGITEHWHGTVEELKNLINQSK